MRRVYIPKIRIPAEIVLSDGRVLTGDAFLEATTRLQDLLNDSNPFFPFIDSQENVHLLNKSAIISVKPL